MRSWAALGAAPSSLPPSTGDGLAFLVRLPPDVSVAARDCFLVVLPFPVPRVVEPELFPEATMSSWRGAGCASGCECV